MKKLILLVSVLLSLLIFVSAFAEDCTPAAEVKGTIYKGKLVISTNATLPPLQYADENGNLMGMRVELGEEIAKRLCLEPETVNVQFDAMIPALGERWDMINTGLFFTEERSKLMYLIPYELNAISISVADNKYFDLTNTEELAGLKVGVEIGGYEEKQIKAINDEQVAAGLKSMTIQTFNTFAEAFQALRAGQIDAVTSIDATAKHYEELSNFKRIIHGLKGSPASLAFANADLADAVNAALQQMLDDGSYQALFDKYGIAPITGWENWHDKFEVWHIAE